MRLSAQSSITPIITSPPPRSALSTSAPVTHTLRAGHRLVPACDDAAALHVRHRVIPAVVAVLYARNRVSPALVSVADLRVRLCVAVIDVFTLHPRQRLAPANDPIYRYSIYRALAPAIVDAALPLSVAPAVISVTDHRVRRCVTLTRSTPVIASSPPSSALPRTPAVVCLVPDIITFTHLLYIILVTWPGRAI